MSYTVLLGLMYGNLVHRTARHRCRQEEYQITTPVPIIRFALPKILSLGKLGLRHALPVVSTYLLVSR